LIIFCLEVYKSYEITFLFSITHKEYFVFHGDTKRRFNRSWLDKYQWMRYSESENLVFCSCVLFKSSEHES
jgi:hypothetical protein